MRILISTVFTYLMFVNGLVYSQDSTLFYSIGLQGSVANGKTPFWLQSNQFDAIPRSGSFMSANWALRRVYNPGNPRFLQWSGGAELITNVGKNNSIFFTDLYLAGKAGFVELSIGQRKEFMGLMDSTLSSGSLAMSGNSRPYPKLQFSTPAYINIIPGNDVIAFKFSYSDGLLGSAKVNYGNVKEIPNLYMHQKSLYFRIGGKRHKLNLHAGFNHQAMWGGEDKIFTGGLKMWEAYKYVILGKGWAGSRVGNHFGTIDFAAEWKGKSWNFILYRQSIYEDGSLANLTNISDGLNGLSFKRSNVHKEETSFKLNALLLEFVYTKQQGGSVFDFDNAIFGNDNYFNHYVYPQGWSYKGQSLGTPLSGPQSLNRESIYRDDNLFTVNNRFLAFHLGIKATWQKIDFLIKSTYSKNYGTYNVPFPSPLTQYSLLFQAEKPVQIWNTSLLSLSLAADQGKLYPNTSAITLGWRKVGFLK